VKDADKPAAVVLARRLLALGFEIAATSGTMKYLTEQGIAATRMNKVLEGRPHSVDALKSGEIQLVINTSEGAQSIADSFSIRRESLTSNIPNYTTMTGAAAAISAIEARQRDAESGGLEVAPLQSYSQVSA
jgi:carbamoyl-phosphate synthase large subunit